MRSPQRSRISLFRFRRGTRIVRYIAIGAALGLAAVGISADVILGLIERVLGERYFARARAAMLLRLAQ